MSENGDSLCDFTDDGADCQCEADGIYLPFMLRCCRRHADEFGIELGQLDAWTRHAQSMTPLIDPEMSHASRQRAQMNRKRGKWGVVT